MQLREYQRRSIDQLYEWFEAGNHGHPCIVLPTGSGKSHIVAALCKEALQSWPETRILMLTHVKELIAQNAEKLRQHWPGAPLGICSASLRQKDLGEPITFAGIQSIIRRADQIGHIDLIIIDECHLVSHKDEGGYRRLVGVLTQINPALRVIGLTATPFRLGHGLITDEPALFSALLEPVGIEELVFKGFLSPLRSKFTDQKLDVKGVHKRGGEYVESELQAAVNVQPVNAGVVDEIVSRAGDRKAWLIFCAGVDHAQNIAKELVDRGIPAACVTGKTPQRERDQIIGDYRAGKLRALTNANVLTTGFDYPDIDLIALCRPTMSPGLYVQMVGRGMRLKSHTDHCLVLDFAGLVSQHGPIIAVQPPKKPKAEPERAPSTKECPDCGEIVLTAVMECPSCGHVWKRPEPILQLREDDIMGQTGAAMPVAEWAWRKHLSRSSGKEMLAVTYYPAEYSAESVTEYLPILHDGYAGEKSRRQLLDIAMRSGVEPASLPEDLSEAAHVLSLASPPRTIEYRRDGKFFRVLRRQWERQHAST